MSQIKSCLIMLFLAAFLLKSFIPLPGISAFMAIVAGLVFCFSIHDLKTLTRNMVILLLLGSGFFIWSGPGDFDLVQAMIENAGIVTLLLTAPMMGTILYYAPYETVISSFANRYIQTNYMFYVMTMVVATLLCPVMNLATVPFTYQLLSPIAAKHTTAVLHRALTRGFCANIFWAPNLGSMAVVLQYVHITWQELAPVGIVFAVLALIAACIVEFDPSPTGESNQTKQSENNKKPRSVRQESQESDGRVYIMLLVMQVVLNLAALTILTRYAGQSIYVAVAIVALGMPLLSALALGKVGVYWQRLAYFLKNTLIGMSNEFVLFLSIGFFGYALAQSPTIVVIQAQLAKISDYSPHVLVLIIIVTITGLSMTGIHPMITIASLAIALGKMEMGLSNVQLAMSLLAGYTLYLCLSPFSSMVMIMAGLSGQNVYSMGLKLNARFALVLSLLVTIVIFVWQQI